MDYQPGYREQDRMAEEEKRRLDRDTRAAAALLFTLLSVGAALGCSYFLDLPFFETSVFTFLVALIYRVSLLKF